MNGLRAGVAKIDITPPVGIELCGYGPFIGRSSAGVHDPLWCRALVLESDGEPLVIVTCDLIGVLQALTDRVRATIQESLKIPPDRVMVACTHTHSGPNTVRLIGWGEPDESYRASLPESIVETIQAAFADLRPARLAVGRTLVEGIARNRVQNDGTGLIDPEVTVVRITDENHRLRALLFHYGAHPVVMGRQNRLISGDWSGDAERRFEDDPNGPAIACFLNGTCGDINSIVATTAPPDWDAVSSIGARMHSAVAALLPSLQDEPIVSIAARRESVRLPLKQPNRDLVAQALSGYDHSSRDGDRLFYLTGIASERFERTWAEAMHVWLEHHGDEQAPHLLIELHAVRIGPLAFIGVPAEVFTIFGFAIKQQSPFRMTAVVGYSHDLVGYVPRPQDFDDSGFGQYAAIKAPKILGLPEFAPHVGDALVAASVRLLQGVS